MENFVETGGLILPSVDLLIKQVIEIENTLPGWWWSLSFAETNIILSIGPDKFVPDPKHLSWMNTREGDLGIIYSTYTHGDERKIIINKVVETTLTRILERLYTLDVDTRINRSIDDVFKPKGDVPYRYQSQSDLNYLRVQYQRLIDSLPHIRQSEFILREFYIGSCTTSADCSLRGGDDEYAFDHSADWRDGNIGHGVETALDDLLADIKSTDPKRLYLTPQGDR